QGHAIECRVNAEDAEANFAPSTGVLTSWMPPGGPGIRVDSHCFQGYEVPPYYDSLLAKVIAWGRDRAEAVARLQRALDEFPVAADADDPQTGRRVAGAGASRERRAGSRIGRAGGAGCDRGADRDSWA